MNTSADSFQQEQDKQESKQVTFNNLPDELIVQIFSHVSPEDLACSLSKVCIRWFLIAKDVVLWENSSLVYDDSHRLEFRQAIQFAPALAKVEINMFKYINHETIQAMLTGCAAVKYLSFYPNQAVPVKEKFMVLKHYQRNLEELNIYVDDCFLAYNESSDDPSESVFDILSNMINLRVLTLRGCIDSKFINEDTFRNGWAELKELDIHGFTVRFAGSGVHTNTPNPWQNFILLILEHHGQRLRKLSLPQDVFDFSTTPLIEAKFQSSTVENLKICEGCLCLVRNAVCLKKLHVVGMSCKHLMRLQVYCMSTNFPYSKTLDWIRSTPQFLNLTELTLQNIHDDKRTCILKLIKACLNLECLTIYGGCHTPVQLSCIISQLPLIKEFNIHRMPCLRSRHLDLICVHIPSLKFLNLRHNTLVDGILQHYRDNVQSRMPSLELHCDWGFWNNSGGREWGLRHCRTDNLRAAAARSDLQYHDRAKIRKVLDAISDYDDDD